jgi:hypothetical protein
MRKKYNDNSKNFADWTTRKLKQETKKQNIGGGYGFNQLLAEHFLLTEIKKRKKI